MHPSILQIVQAELRKHSMDTFVANPPSIAQGGRGVITPGCPHCKKVLFTTNQFIEHIAVDVPPGILERALTIPVRRM